MAIKIHGNVHLAAPLRVLACLNEKELDYEFVSVNVKAWEHRQEPFRSLNPFGQVPAFEDGNLKLFETRAINRYIEHAYGDKGTPLLSNDLKKMAVESVWMEVEALKYDPPATALTWELGIRTALGGRTNFSVVDEKEPELAKLLDVYEVRLAQSKYLGGDSFSLADLHHIPTLHYLMGSRVKAIIDSRPHVSAWCKDILARPAWQKAVAMKNNH